MNSAAKPLVQSASKPLPNTDRVRLVRVDVDEEPIPQPIILQSPSLLQSRGASTPAFELKFLLEPAQALEVEERLRTTLTLDPYSSDSMGGAYRITTLYCDTPRRDVFHRIGSHKRRKFRLRQYGDMPQVFLERKAKRGLRVKKRREVILVADLPRLSQPEPILNWHAEWYRRQLTRQSLSPVCRVVYERRAYFGPLDDGGVRLTFDRNVRGGLCDRWSFNHPAAEIGFLPEKVVCEFKFRGAMPVMLKTVIAEMQLLSQGFSKYRHCLLASGLREQELANV